MLQKHKKLIVFTLIFSFLLLGTGVFINKNSEVQASDGEMLTMLRGMNQVLGLIAEKLTVINVKDGNVGIGTTSPVSLDVNGWIASEGEVVIRHFSDDNRTVIRSKDGTIRKGAGIDIHNENHATRPNELSLIAGPNGNIILTNGDVGIGTRNPQEALHVAGNLKVDGNIIGGSPVKIAEGLDVEGKLCVGENCITEKEFCMGDTCITEEEFKAIFGDM